MATISTLKPTFVLIQGAFHLPKVYTPLATLLISKGYPTIQPPLKSCTSPESPTFPSTNLIDDALPIRL